MTYSQYIALVGDYIAAGRSIERLCAEVGYPSDAPSVEQFLKAMSVIAAAANNDIKRLVELSGNRLTAFAQRFMLPYRSLQNWIAGTRIPPEYIAIMIGYIMISDLWEEDDDGDI